VGAGALQLITGSILIERVLSHFHLRHLTHNMEMTDSALVIECGIWQKKKKRRNQHMVPAMPEGLCFAL